MTMEPNHLKKFEPLDTRDFVEFSSSDELSIENIKEACKKYFDMPPGTCDVLLTDHGPSCFLTKQITGKKFYMCRFLEQPEAEKKRPKGQSAPGVQSRAKLLDTTPASFVSTRGHGEFVKTTNASFPSVTSTAFPKSVSVAGLLAASKLVEPPDLSPVSLVLESFNVSEKRWSTVGTLNAMLEKTKFSEGGFRDAFIARSTQKEMPTKWVVKKTKTESQANITANLNLTNLQHTRKQVQTNAVARSLAMSFARKTPADFGSCFNCKKVYFSMTDDNPVTVEEFIPGSFTKYMNNNGQVNPNLPEDLKRALEKAESFADYSYASTDQKIMVVDLQGVNYTVCVTQKLQPLI